MLRFILVNDRIPRIDVHCALCCTEITANYVREISTKFCYCSRGCFVSHSKMGATCHRTPCEGRVMKREGPVTKRKPLSAKPRWRFP
jgi:hypothetical protein